MGSWFCPQSPLPLPLWGNVQSYEKGNIVTFVPGNALDAYEVTMQVLCKKTNGNAEAHCCVCGQGFVMFWDRQSRTERTAALHEIHEVLRRHHRNSPNLEAHPNDSFLVPEWSGNNAMAGAKAQGIPPIWDL
jgi:hypothetical protein